MNKNRKKPNWLALTPIAVLTLLISFCSIASIPSRADPILAADAPYATDVAAGGGHTCAIFNANGILYCWGANDYGQLGDGTTTMAEAPSTKVTLPGPALQVSAGLQHTCAVVAVPSTGNQVYCWGNNNSGQLGIGTLGATGYCEALGIAQPAATNQADCESTNFAPPCPPESVCTLDVIFGTWVLSTSAPNAVTNPSGKTAVKVSAGFAHTCAIYTDNTNDTVYCWGNNDEGQLGDGTGAFDITNQVWTTLPTSYNIPHAVTISGLSAKDVSAGAMHTCVSVVFSNYNIALCWGGNGSSQLGFGSTNSTSTPSSLLNFYGSVNGMATGFFYGCGIVDGAVKCWGDNTSGQMGNGNNTLVSTPTAVAGALSGKTVKHIAGGYAHVCAVAGGASDNTTDALYCWGENASGQVGNGSTTPNATGVLTPTAALTTNIPSGQIAKKSSLGFAHTCVIYGPADVTSQNGLYCAGQNDEHQLGSAVSNSTSVLTPVYVDDVDRQEGTIAITSDNEVSMSVTPSGLASATSTVNVTTNISDGYEVFISAEADDNTLTNLSDSSYKITANSGSVANPSALGTNKWGFALSSAATNIVVSNDFDNDYTAPTASSKWAPVPTYANMAKILESAAATSETGDTVSVYFGANVNMNIMAGQYNGRVVYTAVGKQV